MKILMFGRGIISTIYGWALEGAGNTVEFYVRPGRATQSDSKVRLNLTDLRRKEGDQHVELDWSVHLREDLPPDHDYDMIFVSVTHYRFKEVVRFLSTRASQATIVIFNNFWENPQAAAADLPQAQLAWGFPGAGGGFQPNGELYGALFPKVEFGTFGTDPSNREVIARKIFSDAGIVIAEHRNFREWLWVHFAVSTATTAQVYRTGLPRMAVYENREHAMEEAVLNVHEIMPVLSARGVTIKDHPELTAYNQPASGIAEALRLSLRNPGYQAAINGHANPEEMRRMFVDVLAECRQLGVATPRFEAANTFLEKNALFANT